MKTHTPISRREFLKIAGQAGAAIGLGAALAGLAGCRGATGEISNTIATIGGGQTGAATTVSVSAELGREIKIGVVSAVTGPAALFGKADGWWMEYAKSACPAGVVCGDHKLHPIVFAVEDNRSDTATAAESATKLMSEGRVDLISCSGSASLVNAVADCAEALGCPCLSSFHQWRPFVFDRALGRKTQFEWTYAHAVGLEDIAANYLDMWAQVLTNRKVGFVYRDDANGRLWTDLTTGLPPAAAALGYECVLPDPLSTGFDDYSGPISEFIESGCEICCAVLPAADHVDFWRQSVSLGFRPKIVTVGDALLFPHALEAIGPRARNLTSESLWQPDWPYTDSITGKSAQQLAEDYMISTGEQWIAPLAQYAKFEWAVDAFKRVADLDSSDAIIQEVRTTKLNTCMGPIDFTAPVDMTDLRTSRRPTENVYKAPVVGVQWVAGGRFKFQPATVANAGRPELTVAGTVQPLN